jgi:hypothetical protein
VKGRSGLPLPIFSIGYPCSDAASPRRVSSMSARGGNLPSPSSRGCSLAFGRSTAARRGSIDNSPSQCASRHTQQERAENREKENCAHWRPPGCLSGFISLRTSGLQPAGARCKTREGQLCSRASPTGLSEPQITPQRQGFSIAGALFQANFGERFICFRDFPRRESHQGAEKLRSSQAKALESIR